MTSPFCPSLQVYAFLLSKFCFIRESCLHISVKICHQRTQGYSVFPFIYATFPWFGYHICNSFKKYWNRGSYFWRGYNYVNNSLISLFIYLTLVPWDHTERDPVWKGTRKHCCFNFRVTQPQGTFYIFSIKN